MKAQGDVVSRLACHGQVKYGGINSGTVSWRSGSLVVHCYEDGWKIDLFCDSSPNPLLSLKLNPRTIIKVICKAIMVIELNDGAHSSIYFKPSSDKERNAMKQLGDFIGDLKENYNCHQQKPLLTSQNQRVSTCVSPSVSRFGSIKNSNTPSPQKFTSVKEPKKREKLSFDENSDDECKENHMRNPYKSANSDKFLQQGIEKARDNLDVFGTANFYNKTSTPFTTRSYGAFATLSSSKRSTNPLGLMPDPSPKKSRLSEDVPYTWSKNRSSENIKPTQQQHFQGFSNLGNTCYMNAILQSLFGLDTFSTDILHINHRIFKVISKDSLYFSLARLLQLRKRFASDQTKRDLLKNVKSAISSSAKRFSGYQQHDAHEFLGQVLDQLKEEVNKVLKSTPSPHRDESDKEYSASRDYVNPTYQNFEFEVLHTITCTQCRENVSKAEQFNDLSMEMPRSRNVMNTRSIQEALDLFFRKETLEYTCEKCGCNKAEVTHKFTRLPRVLVLHLKRYRFDMSASRHAKVANSIHIPRFLTLQNHCVEETTPAFPVVLPCDQRSYRFKKNPGIDTNDGWMTEQNTRTPCKKLRYDDSKKEEDGIHSSKPITLEDDDDPELEKVLEISLKEANEKNQNCTDEGLFGADDSELEKVLEMSRLENEKSVNFDHDYGKDLQSMSEEEQMRLAIEQSLREAEFSYLQLEDAENTNTLNSSKSTTVSSMDTDLSSQSLPSGIRKLNQSAATSSDKNLKPCTVNNKNSVINSGNVDTVSEEKTAKELEKYIFGSDDENKETCSSENVFENDFRNCDQNKESQDLTNCDNDNIREKDKINCLEECEDMSEHRNVSDKEKESISSCAIQIDDNTIKNESSEHGLIKIKDSNDSKTENKTSFTDHITEEDFTLFCNEDSDLDNDWLSLENKENKQPDRHNTENPSIKYEAEEDIDDTPLPKVENEKGDLPYSYRLISVVNHIGNSSVVGHYISDVYDIQKGCWFSCDDSHVVKASEAEVRSKRERSGYIFFYLSKEIFEDLQTNFALQNGKRKSSDN